MVTEDIKNTVRLEIAGIHFTVRSDDKKLTQSIQEQYQLFLSNEKRNDGVNLTLKVVEKLPANGSIPQGFSFSSGTMSVSLQLLVGSFNREARQARADLLSACADEALGHFLRFLCCLLLFDDHGLVLHATGIVKNGYAYIFFGPSGSGKTTVATRSSPYTVLSDEHVFIREIDGSFKACATPEWGDMQSNLSHNGTFAIGGLFRLVKDSEFSIKRIPSPLAISQLLTFPPGNCVSQEKILGRCRRLGESIPCFELHFSKNNDFWEYIDAHRDSYRDTHGYYVLKSV